MTKKFKHICWDGCMFPNDVMMKQETVEQHFGVDDPGAGESWVAGIKIFATAFRN